MAKASKHRDGESEIERNRAAKEKTKSEANFLRSIRIESNNGTKAGGKKTLALPTDFLSNFFSILNQNNKHGTGSVEILPSIHIIRNPSTGR